jgi:hypothetical protein
MFIVRSAAKIRVVRLAFLVVCVLPCGLLVGWAVERRSDRHRAAIIAAVGRAIGASVTADGVQHLRPGVMRLRQCVVAGADGRPVLAAPMIEIEDAGSELRVRIDQLDCDAAAARWLSQLGWAWLGQEARFPRTCIVDVAALSWRVAPDPQAGRHEATAAVAHRPLRVECVARPQARAIRCVRPSRGERTSEELVRIVRSRPGPEAASPAPQWEVDVDWREPVPLPVAAAFLGGDLQLGAEATLTGTLHASCQEDAWEGTADGHLAGIDLAACGAAVGIRADGLARVDIKQVAWSGDRLRECEIECLAGPGRVEQRWLEAVATALACRAGPAFRSLQNEPERAFDVAGCVLRVGERGCSLASPARLAGPLVTAAGLSVLDPPLTSVPAERLAWLLAAPQAVGVPSQGPGAWLMSRLPGAAAGPTATGQEAQRAPAVIQAEQPGRRGGI